MHLSVLTNYNKNIRIKIKVKYGFKKKEDIFMENLICQSCGMPMESKEIHGTNNDGSNNEEYCIYCYQKGNFTSPNVTM
jgi:hypothetical protein